MSKKESLLVAEDEVVYACTVLDAVAEALDRAAAQPKLAPQLTLELIQNTPEIIDALLAITQPECRPILYDLCKSAMNLVKACLPKKKQ